MAKETSKQAVLVGRVVVSSKWRPSGRSACVLFSIIHLLLELLRLLLVDKAQSS